MLIVSRKMLSDPFSDYAFAASADRTIDTHIVVRVGSESHRRLLQQLSDTAAGLSIPLSALRSKLDEWLICSDLEADFFRSEGARGQVFAKSAWQPRLNSNRRADLKIYDNAVDLLLALVGEIESNKNYSEEIRLANMVYNSSRIKSLIVGLSRKTINYSKMPNNRPKVNDRKWKYKVLHNIESFEQFEREYTQLTISKCIGVIHDIAEQFADKGNPPWKSPPIKGDPRKFGSKDQMRQNVSTVWEDQDWSAEARWAGVPVWAGPSGTTHIMCGFAKKIGGGPNEIIACAYAIFAFWAVDYPKSSTAIHHLFGVMTGARDHIPIGMFPHAFRATTMYSALMNFLGEQQITLRSRL